MVKRNHQAKNSNQEWLKWDQKELLVNAVHVITTEADAEPVTMTMFAIWSKHLPMNQLPQCLFGNVVKDISGPNADPNPMKVSNFNKGLTDHLDVAYVPGEGDTKRHNKFAKVEVNTIRDLDLRLPNCDGKSMREILRGVKMRTGDRHRLIMQVYHKVTDPETVMVTCRARDADKVRVLMKRWPLLVTDHYAAGWDFCKEGVRDHLLETFMRDANGHWICRHDIDYEDRRRDTVKCDDQTRELMELFRELYADNAPG